MSLRRMQFLFILGTLIFGARVTAAHETVSALADWREGYTLFLLEENANPHNARRWIQSHGGQVALILSERVLTGWVAAEHHAEILEHAGIRSIRRHGESLEPVPELDRNSRMAVSFFEAVHRSEPSSPQMHKPVFPPGLDAFVAEDIVDWDVLQNVQTTLSTAKVSSSSEITANSEYMLGTVAVSLFFVESDGSGSDPDTYDWTSGREQEIYDEVAASLSWWSSQAETFADCWVSFLILPYYATADTRCAQWREPSLHDSDAMASVISDVMQNFGYTQGSTASRVTAFNFDQRSVEETDWAYSAFIVANPSGSTSFTDGLAAWAYLGGPYTVLLERSFNWQFRQVFAHESAHIFGACDEYYQEGYGGCNDCDGCWTTGVDNGNCEQCNPASVACMMKANTWNLCEYTPGQIGWWRSPCSTGELGQPVIADVDPADALQGENKTIFVYGEHFNIGTTADLGSGVTVLSTERISDQVLEVQVEVDLDTSSGFRDVEIIGPDGQVTVADSAFVIPATGVHFVSPSGSNEWPYRTPLTAAVDLTTVLDAASAGDTVRCEAGVLPSVRLTKSLVLEGAWGASFEARLPEHNPTILQPKSGKPALTALGPGIDVSLDGFVFSNGRGQPISAAEIGSIPAGGGVRCIEATMTLRSCRFEDNLAGTASVPGAGAGALFWKSNATLESCTFEGNISNRGAGVFSYYSELVFQDCTFQGNDLVGSNAKGGAISALASTLNLDGGALRDHTGAEIGGALHLENCNTVRLENVDVDGHSATGDGGGLWSDGSNVEVLGSRFYNNSSGGLGGGLAFAGGSLTLHGVVFDANVAETLGSAVYASDVILDANNLTLARSAGEAVGAAYFTAIQPGASLKNCIVAHNDNGGLLWGSSGSGDLDWNLYWDNNGFDVSGAELGAQDVVADPRFVNLPSGDLHLGLHSPGIDTGEGQADFDASRTDRGAYGGSAARNSRPAKIGGIEGQRNATQAEITWAPSGSPDVAEYVVFRSTSADLPPAEADQIAVVPAPTSRYIDPDAQEGAWYFVAAVNTQQHAGGFSPGIQLETSTDAPGRKHHQLELYPIYPNPSLPGSWIRFQAPDAASLHIAVFDARGRRVKTLQNGRTAAGMQRLFWNGLTEDGRRLPAGVYWVRLQRASTIINRKLILLH